MDGFSHARHGAVGRARRAFTGSSLSLALALFVTAPGPALADAAIDGLAETFAIRLAPKWWTPGEFDDARLLGMPIRWDRCADRTGKTWPLGVAFTELAGHVVTAGLEVLLPGRPYLRDRGWDEHIERIRDPQAVVSRARAAALASAFPRSGDLWLSVAPYVELSARRYWLVPASAARSFGFDAYFPDCDGGMAKTARVPRYVHYYPGVAVTAESRAPARALVGALLDHAPDPLELVEPVTIPATDLAGLPSLDALMTRILAAAVGSGRWLWLEQLELRAAVTFSFPGTEWDQANPLLFQPSARD